MKLVFIFVLGGLTLCSTAQVQINGVSAIRYLVHFWFCFTIINLYQNLTRNFQIGGENYIDLQLNRRDSLVCMGESI